MSINELYLLFSMEATHIYWGKHLCQAFNRLLLFQLSNNACLALSRLYAIDAYMRHTTFSLWCHFQQCPWDLGSAPAERVGQGEIGRFQHWALVVRPIFLLCRGDHSPRGMTIASWLDSGCGLSHECAQDGCNGTCVKLEASKPT